MSKDARILALEGENGRLKAANSQLRRNGFGNNVTKVVNSAITYGVLAYIAFQLKEVGVAWAGKITIADVKITANATANASGKFDTTHSFEFAVKEAAEKICGQYESFAEFVLPFALFVTIVAILYGRNQARLRRLVIEQLAPYQQLYEKGIDPKRTSSKLTTKGRTRPEDE